jgi:hypothetical protein
VTTTAPPLPPPPPTPVAPRPRVPPSGATPAHVNGLAAIVGVVILLVVIATAGAVFSAITKPAAKPPCPQVVTCLTPGQARGPSTTATYRDAALGYSFQYPANLDQLKVQNGVVTITNSAADDLMRVAVVPASQENAETAFVNWHDADQNNFNLGSVDTTSINRIVSPSIGFVPGTGATYNGVVDATSGGKDAPVNEAIIAASDGNLTVVVTLAIASDDNGTINQLRSDTADLILDSFTWHS